MSAHSRIRDLGLSGCGDNSCLFESAKGMATNGGCRCRPHKYEIALSRLSSLCDKLERELINCHTLAGCFIDPDNEMESVCNLDGTNCTGRSGSYSELMDDLDAIALQGDRNET